MHGLMMRGVNCQSMVATRHSNHFVALPSVYTPYVSMVFERRRLIGSGVLYRIVNQCLGASTG
jgi:hypothetical protein